MQKNMTGLTEGPIWKKMLLFALPVLLGNVFQQFYNAFDSWCVGNYIGEFFRKSDLYDDRLFQRRGHGRRRDHLPQLWRPGL